eukprot:1732994-Pyramimonas_sp.AAC.1
MVETKTAQQTPVVTEKNLRAPFAHRVSEALLGEHRFEWLLMDRAWKMSCRGSPRGPPRGQCDWPGRYAFPAGGFHGLGDRGQGGLRASLAGVLRNRPPPWHRGDPR